MELWHGGTQCEAPHGERQVDQSVMLTAAEESTREVMFRTSWELFAHVSGYAVEGCSPREHH